MSHKVSDETLRRMLEVEFPATYRKHLRYPLSGPESKKQEEIDIKKATKTHKVVIESLLLGVDWAHLQEVADMPAVDKGMKEFLEDPTEDAGVHLVNTVLAAFRDYILQEASDDTSTSQTE